MCGIVGTNFISQNFTQSVDLLSHRGPDNQSALTYKNYSFQGNYTEACFGHTRLSIIDLDDEANQPMEFDDIIITFNGEIYNFQEIIKNENLNCITKSDTEVIIRLYQKYQESFLDKLNGMFSFCIFDKQTETFFCARDRFGKKPFYYSYQNGKFIYASEIKTILKLQENKADLNFEALNEYLSFMTPIHDNTFYQNIKKLPAGYTLKLSNQKLQLKKYYDIDSIQNKDISEVEALKNIENLLIDSVKLRLTSDVEVATLLSGGIDSSLVSALYSQYSSKQINTFCIGYDEHIHYSELPYAKTVANHIDSNHHELLINKFDFLETIDKMIEHTDEPFGDSASIPTYLLSQYIHKNGIKVALSGEGSDESFLGYDNYFKMLNYYNSTPTKEPFNLTKEWEFNNRALHKKHIYQMCGETFTHKQKEKLFNKNINEVILSQYKSSYPPYKWLTYIDFKIWIAEVLMTKIDRMSMAHSLELRAPFLDYKLVEYLLTIPENIKRGDTNKYLLKQIATQYLPNEIVHRQKKGFSFPFIEWLYDEYKDKILFTILTMNKKLKIFNEDFVRFLYNEAKEKRFKQHVWHLYIFARWFEKKF